jgi:RNA polymerase sigma factor (sigma-70 family)
VSFRDRSDDELRHLGDDDLITYGRAARDAGDLAAARRALAFLVYGHEADVTRRISLRVPPHVVDEVSHDVLVRAIAAAFDGQSVGQFRSWLNTIVDRTAADYFRRASRRPKESILPSEHAGDNDVWGSEPAVDGETAAVELRIVIDEVLDSFNPIHRKAIELNVFEGFTAREVCGRIEGMSEDNVAQIASRFRAKLRARLEEAT